MSRLYSLRAQTLKIIKILKFSSELEIFKRATHQTPIFCGEFWRSGLKISSEIEIFKGDWKFQAILNFFKIWALRVFLQKELYFFANTCGACIRTPANTGKYFWGVFFCILAKFSREIILGRMHVAPVFPKGPNLEKNQDLEIFKRAWNFQASHPPNPYFFVGNSGGQYWKSQARLKFSSESENFKRSWIFSRFGPLGFAPARIQENIPGELFMYWFRARGTVALSFTVLLYRCKSLDHLQNRKTPTSRKQVKNRQKIGKIDQK